MICKFLLLITNLTLKTKIITTAQESLIIQIKNSSFTKTFIGLIIIFLRFVCTSSLITWLVILEHQDIHVHAIKLPLHFPWFFETVFYYCVPAFCVKEIYINLVHTPWFWNELHVIKRCSTGFQVVLITCCETSVLVLNRKYATLKSSDC